MSEHDPEVPDHDEPHPPIIEHEPAPVPPPAERPAATEDAPAPVVPAAEARRGGTPMPVTLLLAALLAGGIYWSWSHPRAGQGAGPATDAGWHSQLAAQAQASDQQIQTLSGRVDALVKQAAQPAATQPSNPEAVSALGKRLDDLSARLDALSASSAKPSDSQPASPASTDSALASVPALVAQQKSATDALDQRLSKLEAAAGQTPAPDQGQGDQKAQIDALQQRLTKLEAAAQAAQPEDNRDQAALAALDGRVGRLEQGAGAVQGAVRGVAQDAGRAIRLEAAQASLTAGQPLGDVPGAPPALARFATTPPPTEASLRAAFPEVAAAARAASQPNLANRSFLDRALARLQQSVTVRRGDHVIVGDPASGVLARAQLALDNGDLKGAADALADLDGPAASAVSGWVAQVRALLDARAALAAMARG